MEQEYTISVSGDKPFQPFKLNFSYSDGEFIFHLNPVILERIQAARLSSAKLKFERQFIKELRQKFLNKLRQSTSLFTSMSKFKQEKKFYFPYELTFISCYKFSNKANERVMRTVISLDGDVFQQIQKKCLIYSQGYEIILAHQWIIKKLFEYLYINIEEVVKQIVNSFIILMAVVNTAFQFHNPSQIYWWNWLYTFSGWLLWFIWRQIQPIIIKQIQPIIMYYFQTRIKKLLQGSV